MMWKLSRLALLLIILIAVVTVSANGSRSNRRKSNRNQQSEEDNHRINNDGLIGRQKSSSSRRRSKGKEHDLRQLSDGAHPFQRFVESSPNGGLFPKPFNVAMKAKISANATCGDEDEEFCRMADIYSPRQQSQCELCDSSDDEKSHHIENAIDGTHSWWQSPTLAMGKQFEFVTIDVDLKQVYEIYSVKLKSAESPLPKAWLLEKSIDGDIFEPWQYFAVDDADCLARYGLPGRSANYTASIGEVTCTTQYSESIRLKYGETKFIVMPQRLPPLESTSAVADNFTLARFVRIRMQGIVKDTSEIDKERTVKWTPDSEDLLKRAYYSIQSLMVIGRCFCSGHAAKCRGEALEDSSSVDKRPQCECMHNTCGKNCDKCCPLFNQRPFRVGTPQKENKCEKCQCHGHATECRYSEDVDKRNLSLNVRGKMSGGGVCVNCANFTAGINCEKCQSGYYRPYDRPPDHDEPCLPCNCNEIGSTGLCNPLGGECVCKLGFTGAKCDTCAVGFNGENCQQCSCDIRGTIQGGECDESCQCKQNVEGEKCDKCQDGYFGLSVENPDGCLKCYCSGIGTTCESFEVMKKSIETLEGWSVTDISKSQIAYPVKDNDTGFYVFGMYELPDVEAVYWSAPKIYLGNRLENYGSQFIFQLDYVIVRGDTSGKPTSGPNFILIGKNGLKIAYGDGIFSNSNASVDVKLTETSWYHVPKTVKDIITRLRRTDYRGDPVTRTQFLSVLTDIDSILIRGTYHTDQAEGILKRATLYSGDLTTSNEIFEIEEETKILSLVEKCHCPKGYSGLSCESCMFGHISIVENSTTHEKIIKCMPCACNGHAEVCDVVNNVCGSCLHNTIGESCESCAIGFYGDATKGTANDCRKCACPLSEASNNVCELKNDGSEDYICTECPAGHIGDHCEKCEDGFYGNPLEIDSKCLPCACNGDPCDQQTGKCIKCEGNTEGWRCEKCKKGFYGDPAGGCKICECSDYGAISNVCDPIDGKCSCKPNYAGRLCDQCEIGHANISLNCAPCECNEFGSSSQICDRISGQCACKFNAKGLKCDTCEEEFFGLDAEQEDCEACNCHVSGSEDRICDQKTGQCKCRPHVAGRTCDRCESGYWNLDTKRGCEDCECNQDGSEHENCDQHTGECVCKPGVEGAKCDRCRSGYYGFSASGCKKCNICDSAAKVCDQETGRCICPPLSHGSECEHCHPNTWGWEYLRGCKNCECNQIGAVRQSCDVKTGQCECKEGFTGRACDYCAIGYYSFPSCQPCNCDVRGSKNPSSYDTIDCDDLGQCPCKDLVTGLKCDECRQATFGLSLFNPKGCTRCFCFGRSQVCSQHDLIWGQVRSMGPRNVTAQFIDNYRNHNDDIDFVIMSHVRNNYIYRESALLKNFNSLTIVPGTSGDVTIGTGRTFRNPLYVELSKEFLGDKTTSYGGFLNFSITTHDSRTSFTADVLSAFPLVQMHTHYHLTLNYFHPESLDSSSSYSIVIHESYWRHATNGYNISRAIMMTALQNIKHIFLRVTTSSDFLVATLDNVTLSVGMTRNGNNNAAIASGVEKCECNDEIYSGDSCQDPAEGYFRWRNVTTPTNHLEDLVGKVVPCECNGRSDSCNKETGECLNCKLHTGGINCERCAEGYYGHPDDSCTACPCPETNKNFARGCFVDGTTVSCYCKEGYTGPLCDRCARGFFGNPHEPDGKCESCDCNLEGIVSDECDYLNGQCNCKKGVIGRRCDKCELPRHLLIDYECQLCDKCTQTLLDTIDEMIFKFEVSLEGINLHDLKAPWYKLHELSNITDEHQKRFDDLFEAVDSIDNFNDVGGDELLIRSEALHGKSNRISNSIDKKTKKIEQMKLEADQLLMKIRDIMGSVQETIINLENYGTNDEHVKLPSALREAQKYLDDIEQKSKNLPTFNDVTKCPNEQLEFWTDEYEAQKERKAKLDGIYADQQDLLMRLDDLKNLTHRVFRDSSETEAFITKNKKDFDKLKEKVGQIKGEEDEIEKLLDTNVIAASSSKLESLQDNFDKANAENVDLIQLQEEVEKKILEDDEELNEIRKNILPEAKKHAEDLAQRSKVIVGTFQNSKDGAHVALLAGTAHKNISDEIQAAKIAAQEAYDAASQSQDALNPIDEETFLEKGNDLKLESDSIQEDADVQIKKIKELKTELNNQKELINNMAGTIRESGKKNNEISQQITRLKNNDGKKEIEETLTEVDAILDGVRSTELEVNEINQNVDNLKDKLKELDPEWDSKFGLAEENVAKSLINIRDANNIWNINEPVIQQQNEKFAAWNDSISSKLQELRDKIAKAKHAAESVRVSLESPDESCIRSYFPTTIGVTTSNHIILTFALNSRKANSPLLFIQGDEEKFIALEMVNRKVLLLWNFGDDTGTIAYPTEIEIRDPKYDDAWYKVEVIRSLNVGSLSVSRMTNNGNFDDSSPTITAATSINSTRFVISQNNRIYVGGVPEILKPKDLKASSGISVIIHQLFVDHFSVGLWHFASSEGKCEGAMLGPTEASDSSITRHFNGHGYSVIKSISTRPYKKTIFSLQMTFKTLDENALLFLTVDEKNNRSISLTLHEGKLIFRIDYGGESQLEINTTNRYNNGKWVNVEAAREFKKKGNVENGSLKVNHEEPQSGSPTKPITDSMLPEVSKADFYIGGTSPGFKSGTTKAPGAENAFLGCMRDIQINGEIFDPLESQNYYGIEPTCKDVITKAGFYGNGYLELPSHSLKKRANFGFVFRTLQPDCLLMFSGYPPQTLDDYDEKDVRGNFSVSLINGHIHVWLVAGKGRVELESNLTLNDGEFHVVNINKMGRKFELRINDKFELVRSLSATPAQIISPEEFGGLFLGGVPDFPEFDNMAPTFNGLKGAIKDVVFNNKSVSFDNVLNFKNVHIGGLGPTMGTSFDQEIKTEPVGPKFRENTEGCQRVGSYSYETNAFKFGNQPFSYSMLQIPSQHLWHRNFNIQFGFRTFYPDGFLFVAPDSRDKPKHYVYLFLRNGNVILNLRGRQRSEISIPLKTNNGQWHHVTLEGKKDLLTLTVSNAKSKKEEQARIKIPKKFFASNLLFIGGLPNNVPKLHREVISKKENFKGCIRRFNVNGITQDLTKHFYNLGQCFPRIEKGSYFSGDAYAEYKSEFNVGKHLEIEMEFKTSEMNGILLSIAETSGTPSLSIGIYDGKLTMSCDFNNGEILRAESKLPSKFALCDNKWHNISALYDTHQIAIRIDDKDSVVAAGFNNGKLHTNSPVYIGGVPETSHLSRTIMMRENFKGCIRNVKINSGYNGMEIVDWTDMAKLQNVLLNECPLGTR